MLLPTTAHDVALRSDEQPVVVAPGCTGERLGILAKNGRGGVLLIRKNSEPFFELPQMHTFPGQLNDLNMAIESFIKMLQILQVRSHVLKEMGAISDTCTVGTSQHLWHLLLAEEDRVQLSRPERRARMEFAQTTQHVWATPVGLRVIADRQRALPPDLIVTCDNVGMPTLGPLSMRVLELLGHL
jgi:hypothetical protein